ncbi:alpha-tocopherol transfer protein-like [Glandiceps talaboti]
MSDLQKPYVCTLSATLQKKAEDELNERADTRPKFIQALREKTMTRPDIKFRTDDAFLLRFLRARKFDVDRAFKNLVRYYEIQREYPEVYYELRVDRLRYVWEVALEGILPGKDKLGRRIGLFRPGQWNPDSMDSMDTFRAQILTLERLLEDEENQINGVVFIGDFVDYGIKQALHTTPSMAKLSTAIVQNAMPLRTKAIHFINTPALFEAAMTLWRQFMNEKMKNRMIMHSGEYGTLHEHIPSSNLPSDFGGTLPEVTECTKKWLEELEAWEAKYLADNAGYGVLRKTEIVGSNDKRVDPSAGIVGSFKKIDD